MDSVLAFNRVSKQLAGQTVLHQVSFELPQHGVVGLVGPNGAGKTTLFRLALGLLSPSQGEISLFGQPASPRQRLKVGFSPDNDGLYADLTGRQNLEFAARVYGATTPLDPLLDQLGIAHAANRPVARYSQGMKKRLALARSLLNNPSLLLLDEPFNGLDPEGQLELRELVESLSHQVCILVSSHDLGLVKALCPRILVLKTELRFDGEINQILHPGEQDLFAAYLRLLGKSR